MKNIKKLLIILLVIAMSCTVLLTSCGKDDDDSKSGSKSYKYEKPINLYVDGDSVLIESAYDNGKIVSNRVTVLSWGESDVITYAYDNAGKINKITFQEGFYSPLYTYQLSLADDGISYSTDAKVEYYENGAVKKVELYDFATIDFDEKGRISSFEEEAVLNYEGDSKTPSSYTVDDEQATLTYDSKGYVTAIAFDETNVSYTYDSKGNVLSETIVDSDECTVTECEYDSKRNPTKITVTEYNDTAKSEIEEKSVMEFSYNSKNLVTSATSKAYENENEIDYEITMSFEYDAKGRISKVIQEYEYGNGVREYQYDSNGRIVGGVATSYNKEGNVEYKNTVAMEYDSLGRLIKETDIDYEGDAMDSKQITEYEYDNKFRETKETRTYYDENGDLESKKVYDYTYNAEGNKTTTVTEYDKDGNVTGTGNW